MECQVSVRIGPPEIELSTGLRTPLAAPNAPRLRVHIRGPSSPLELLDQSCLCLTKERSFCTSAVNGIQDSALSHHIPETAIAIPNAYRSKRVNPAMIMTPKE